MLSWLSIVSWSCVVITLKCFYMNQHSQSKSDDVDDVSSLMAAIYVVFCPHLFPPENKDERSRSVHLFHWSGVKWKAHFEVSNILDDDDDCYLFSKQFLSPLKERIPIPELINGPT